MIQTVKSSSPPGRLQLPGGALPARHAPRHPQALVAAAWKEFTRSTTQSSGCKTASFVEGGSRLRPAISSLQN
eukprot:scaffold260960_cov13-Tisochrysis_lutea.AAC.1